MRARSFQPKIRRLREALRHARAAHSPRAFADTDVVAGEAFFDCLQYIADTLGLPLDERTRAVRVYAAGPGALLGECARAGHYDDQALDEIARNLLGGESYFLPEMPAVYLADPSAAVLGEEAAHLLRHVSGGTPSVGSRAELFYQGVLHEALGYFGSKLIDPARETPDESLILGTYHSPDTSEFDEEQHPAFFVAANHLRAESDPAHAPLLCDVYDSPMESFVGAIHLLGYALGEQLFGAFEEDRVSTDEVRALFLESWDEPGAAFASYLRLRSRQF